MDKNKALNILKLSGYASREDVKIQYDKEKNRIMQSITRTNSEQVRSAYTVKIQELDEAYNFLMDNFEANSRSAIKAPKIKLKTSHIVLISLAVVLIFGGLTYITVRNHQINELLEEGNIIFNSAKIGSDQAKLQEAKRLFEKAEKKGSLEGKFYHGLVMHKLGDKQAGMVKMQRAEKEGFSDSTMNFKIYQTWKTQLNSK